MAVRMLRISYFLPKIIVIILVHYFREFSEAQLTDPKEASALNAIRSTLIDPLGKLNSWNDGDPCAANWRGVICYNSTLNDGYLHVQELRLLKNNLSGNLAPEIGLLSHLLILDFMWNNINGTIPKDIGSIKSLKLLLLNGNQLSGSLPEELGFFPYLDRIQIDQNQISGTIPKTFAYLNKTRHFHMNNNSLSGQIPSELYRLPSLVHLLLDNNNLSGYIPPELWMLPNLLILQLDNNNFSGSTIPSTFRNIRTLLKLSLRNCSLRGAIPDLSEIPQLGFLDLSHNQLTGSIPSNKLSDNITTIDLSNNFLNGSIPSNFSGFPNLQRLSLDNNRLQGSVPSTIWNNMSFSGNKSLILDFQNNNLANLSQPLDPPANVSLLLYGNPVCAKENQLHIVPYCQPQIIFPESESSINTQPNCSPCPEKFEYNPLSPLPCFCAIPFGVGYRLKSPGFSDFLPYYNGFQVYLTSGLNLSIYQLDIVSFLWEEGPRLRMSLKFFPNYTTIFDANEVIRIAGMFTGWQIPDSDIFGPYELLNITLGYYENAISKASTRGLSTGVIVGIVVGAVAVAVILSIILTILIMKRLSRNALAAKRRSSLRTPIKIDGVKGFSFQEMAQATNNFSNATQVGQGGYGKVYKGVLADGTLVAIKRAQEGSLQGSNEFCNEIELLSRLHHRNLVSLLGYCDEADEQMLVYDFMPNGTLRDHLSGRIKGTLTFSMRLRIALGSARGILYLHTEADPPIFHRDIKATNILLDSKFVAKVADFGLSKLAPALEEEGSAPGHVSTVVKGTPGYLDPEYFLTHKLTDKSDVYSLGVVFLELLTGMHPISHGKNIVREVKVAYESGMVSSLMDKCMGSYPLECVERWVSLAIRCCKDETDARPSMVDIVRELDNIWHLTASDTTTTLDDHSSSDHPSSAKQTPPPSYSSSTTTTAAATGSSSTVYMSSDVSGSDLLSDVIPKIHPR